jgi:beta-ureidopropionase / N-carbamoyl-L-amino-acid hydrolase
MSDPISFPALFDAVAAIGRGPGGWTRPPWSAELRAAEDVVAQAGARAGLAAWHDPAGNLWLTDPAAPAEGLVACGSHLDTVPDGGALDGALGVVSAVAAVARLRAQGVPDRERLAVISFADEEGWRFGTPLFGSRMLVGAYDAGLLDRVDRDGVALRDVGPPDPEAARGLERRLAAFLELHVEQGSALGPHGAPLGVCTGLAARGRYAWAIEGHADHAGTTPMAGRRDALVAAARLVLAAESQALARPGAVATVGRIAAEPGGSNSIPGRTTGTLDVRGPTARERDAVLAAIRQTAPAAEVETLSEDDGVAFDPAVRVLLHEAAAAVGARAIDLPSYAGHDAGGLAAAGVPAGMLFVRSTTGISHHPDEDAVPADRELGCQALTAALASLLTAPRQA